MKFLSQRVSVSEAKESLSIVISPDKEQLKQTLLFTWIVFWTISGIVVLIQLFSDYSREEKMFMFVWILFWAYFEYITVYAWLWKAYGFEKLLLKDGKLYYERNIKGKGKKEVLDKNVIIDIKITEDTDSSIISNLNKSYWVVGGERIILYYNSGKLKLGMKLNNNESEAIVRLITKKL